MKQLFPSINFRSISIVLFFLTLSLSIKAQFGPPNVVFNGEAQYAGAIYTGDADMDGDDDVFLQVVSNIYLYRNIGSGNFSGPELILTNYAVNYVYTDIAKVVDVDNDGDGELTKNATWFRNNG